MGIKQLVETNEGTMTGKVTYTSRLAQKLLQCIQQKELVQSLVGFDDL